MRPLEHLKPGELILAMRQQGICFVPYYCGVHIVWKPELPEHKPLLDEFMARQQEANNPVRRMVLAGLN